MNEAPKVTKEAMEDLKVSGAETSIADLENHAVQCLEKVWLSLMHWMP